MKNKPTEKIIIVDRVLKGLTNGRTLGESLAHGLSKRGLSDDYETLSKRLHIALEKNMPTSNTRGAAFISIRKLLLYSYKENTLVTREIGKQDGTDKKAIFFLLSISAAKRLDKHELGYSIQSHLLSARRPHEWNDEQVASISKHCLAQMMRTAAVDNDYDAITQFRNALIVASIITQECDAGRRTYDLPFAILSEHGIIVAEYIEKYGSTFCKTAIAYTAMAPKQAEHLQKLFNDGEIIVSWKKQGKSKNENHTNNIDA